MSGEHPTRRPDLHEERILYRTGKKRKSHRLSARQGGSKMSPGTGTRSKGWNQVRPALDAIILRGIQSQEVPKALDARPTIHSTCSRLHWVLATLKYASGETGGNLANVSGHLQLALALIGTSTSQPCVCLTRLFLLRGTCLPTNPRSNQPMSM